MLIMFPAAVCESKDEAQNQLRSEMMENIFIEILFLFSIIKLDTNKILTFMSNILSIQIIYILKYELY